ncbi:MAG: hypothetical protein JRJ19_01375 [Deltaproteobacteria bacterium]|nr:hypothetical protein [Deltaproteobacteria bacterium]
MALRKWCVFVLIGFAIMSVRGCDCAGDPGDPYKDCLDNDLDGYGDNCMLGPDCDDENPDLNFSCDCDVLEYEGCPCTEGEEPECWEADAKFLDVGICKAGKRFCENEKFTACIGQVLPEKERCDNIDNDCDGSTDEMLTCTDCGPRCHGVDTGPGTEQEFELDDDNNRGLELDPNGNIVLEEGENIRLTFLYVANSDEGTVSKINTETGQEEGRYISALYSPDPRNRGSARASGNAPSRTAVDFNGDVWVANRAFNQQGTVTKIAHQNCPDLNGNQQVDTSRDANGNGRIELGDPAEYLGEADECILFTVNIGGNNSVPRALALDAGGIEGGMGNAWVGAYSENKFYKLDPSDGHVLAEVAIGLHPYGAAIDSKGILWSCQQATGRIVSIDTNNNTAGDVIQIEGWSGSYGIAVDMKDRVWVGGYQLEGAARYDPADGSSMTVPTPNVGVGRGIAADADGNIWLAHSWLTGGTRVGRVTRFNSDDGSQLQTFEFPSGSLETIGVGLDFDGYVWGVNRQSDDTCKLDPGTGAVECYPTGAGTYTYSDFTGFALRNFTAPRGTYWQVFEGCALPTETRWKQVTWEATVPDGTLVTIYVKFADTIDGLQSATRYGPFTESPVDLIAEGVLEGHYMLVEVILSTDVEDLTPIFKGLGAQWVCQGEN